MAYFNGKKILTNLINTGTGLDPTLVYTKEEIDLKIQQLPNEAITPQDLETILN